MKNLVEIRSVPEESLILDLTILAAMTREWTEAGSGTEQAGNVRRMFTWLPPAVRERRKRFLPVT